MNFYCELFVMNCCKRFDVFKLGGYPSGPANPVGGGYGGSLYQPAGMGAGGRGGYGVPNPHPNPVGHY